MYFAESIAYQQRLNQIMEQLVREKAYKKLAPRETMITYEDDLRGLSRGENVGLSTLAKREKAGYERKLIR